MKLVALVSALILAGPAAAQMSGAVNTGGASVRGGPVHANLVIENGQRNPVAFLIGDGKPIVNVAIQITAPNGQVVHRYTFPSINKRMRYVWIARNNEPPGRYSATWTGMRK